MKYVIGLGPFIMSVFCSLPPVFCFVVSFRCCFVSFCLLFSKILKINAG